MRPDATWFLMHWASTPYHTGNGKASLWKKISTYTRGQPNTVFKLISPDGTGGSLELILKNPPRSRSEQIASGLGTGFGRYGSLGAGRTRPDRTWGEFFRPNVDLNSITRGSYNYAETMIRGLDEHERMDVKPHEASPSFYLNPPAHSGLSDRAFPKVSL